MLSKLKLVLISACVFCALLCVVEPVVAAGLTPRRDSSDKQLCERCGQRLSRVKHHRAYGVGRACHPRCHESKSEVDTGEHPISAPTVITPKEKKRRRINSDPGTSTTLTHNRLRVRASPPTQPDKKKLKQDKAAEITSLLDQTHARRMAALTAVASAAAASSTPSIPSSIPPPIPDTTSSSSVPKRSEQKEEEKQWTAKE
jgi:hypothetical protein